MKKIQEKLENCRLQFVGEWRFQILTPIGSHVNENENLSKEIHQLGRITKRES